MQPSNETILIRRERVFLILAGIFLCAMTMLNLLGITRFVELGPWTLAVGVLPYPITFLCTDFSGVDLAGTSGITQEEFSKIIYDKDNPPTNIPKDLELPKDRAYERRESYPYECFVKSDDEQLRGRRVSEVLDELLKEQDGYYQKSLPPSGG